MNKWINKKVYIYRFTTIPELVKQYGGNITILEKNGEIDTLFDRAVDIEDFGFVHISNFDNPDFIIDESFHGDLCYDFYSFRNDRLLDFKLAIAEILNGKIDKRKKEIEELEALQENLKITQDTLDVVEDKLMKAMNDKGE